MYDVALQFVVSSLECDTVNVAILFPECVILKCEMLSIYIKSVVSLHNFLPILIYAWLLL